jgi:hypothetical protein
MGGPPYLPIRAPPFITPLTTPCAPTSGAKDQMILTEDEMAQLIDVTMSNTALHLFLLDDRSRANNENTSIAEAHKKFITTNILVGQLVTYEGQDFEVIRILNTQNRPKTAVIKRLADNQETTVPYSHLRPMHQPILVEPHRPVPPHPADNFVFYRLSPDGEVMCGTPIHHLVDKVLVQAFQKEGTRFKPLIWHKDTGEWRIRTTSKVLDEDIPLTHVVDNQRILATGVIKNGKLSNQLKAQLHSLAIFH